MSTEVLHTSQTLPEFAPPSAETIERRAFYLDSEDRTLFAWLHTLRNADLINHGVVICAPIGFEQLHAHRGLRHLADELAGRRIPALRFDWDGTGDSASDDHGADRITAWRADVRAAIRWMKTELHCRRVSLVGLRMGATIAALSCDDGQTAVENLVLWAPVTNGRTYVREMTVIDMTSETRPSSGSDSSADIDSAGFILSRETAEELSRLSLLQSRPQCCRILLGTREDTPVDQRLIDRFAQVSIPTEVQELAGVSQMLVEPHRGQLPQDSINQIASWMTEHVMEGVFDLPRSPFDNGSASMQPRQQVSVQGHAGTEVQEAVLRISESPDLFGIATRPVVKPGQDLPLLVLLNAGAAYRIGPGRMTVEMARHFAALGFSCLRLDLCGLGDSVTTSIEQENDSYAGTMFRDIEITLRKVQDRLGVHKFVLMGLCSGAYAAFQSAAQIVNPALIESVLINPLTFFWRDGMSLETAPSTQMIEQHYYLTAAMCPEKWLKLLLGQTRIGMSGAVRMLVERLGLTAPFRRSQSPSIVPSPRPYITHPQIQDLSADLKRVIEKQRHLSMFFATSDPGYGILMRQAARQARRMIGRRQLDLTFIDDADHTFSRRSARRRLLQEMADHLCRRYVHKQS